MKNAHFGHILTHTQRSEQLPGDHFVRKSVCWYGNREFLHMSSMLKQATQTVRVQVTCFSCGNTISLFKNRETGQCQETQQCQETLDIYDMLL